MTSTLGRRITPQTWPVVPLPLLLATRCWAVAVLKQLQLPLKTLSAPQRPSSSFWSACTLQASHQLVQSFTPSLKQCLTEPGYPQNRPLTSSEWGGRRRRAPPACLRPSTAFRQKRFEISGHASPGRKTPGLTGTNRSYQTYYAKFIIIRTQLSD